MIGRDRALEDLPAVGDTEAIALWSALMEGRLVIVGVEESDGRRLLVARWVSSPESDPAALTQLERDVAWLASRGHTFKLIAYELGVSVPLVVRRLRSALAKLRIPTRRDLVRIFAVEPR